MLFRGILIGVLKELGFPDVNEVPAQLVEVGRKYQLSMAPYEARDGFHSRIVAPAGGQMVGRGHMMQTFVHKDWVDDLSYPCRPDGIRDGTLSTTAYIEKGQLVAGQARVFYHPDLLLDSTRSRVSSVPCCCEGPA